MPSLTPCSFWASNQETFPLNQVEAPGREKCAAATLKSLVPSRNAAGSGPKRAKRSESQERPSGAACLRSTPALLRSRDGLPSWGGPIVHAAEEHDLIVKVLDAKDNHCHPGEACSLCAG